MSVQFQDNNPSRDLNKFNNFKALDLIKFDIKNIQESFKELISKVPLDEATGQISLTHTENTSEDKLFYDGCGSLTYNWSKNPYHENGELKKREKQLHDHDFSIFNKELKNSYFYDIYRDLSKFYKIGRFRIMTLPPKKCMSWHSDTELRSHMAIETNTSCKMVIDDECFHIPADGKVYICNTKKFHTAFNGSHKLNRIHLVAGLHNLN